MLNCGDRCEVDNVLVASSSQAVSLYQVDASHTQKAETARRHAIEKYEKNLKLIQELEVKLHVESHWRPGDPDWQDAARLVMQREYCRVLDCLEGLVVARLFELSKMNRAGTGNILFSFAM